jgi:dGTPase
VNHDVDDAIRAGLISFDEIPAECIEVLGTRHAARITSMVNAIIEASSELEGGRRRVGERIAMQDDVMEATDKLKNWMFDHVYKRDTVDETPRVRTVLLALFERFMNEPHLMRGVFVEGTLAAQDISAVSQSQLARLVCDYIAGMTDRFASQTYAELFMPSSWRGV